MSSKFNRNYALYVQTNRQGIGEIGENLGEFIIIEPPFTISFNINRSNMAALNSMSIDIYNLSEKTRSLIFQDRIDPTFYKQIILQAGYDNLSTIFQGNMTRAYSERKGSDIITKIEARDGDFDTRNSIASRTYNKNINKRDVLLDLISGFQFIKEGTITENKEKYNKGTTIDENVFYWIRKQNDGVFIDLEKINILKDNEVLTGDVPLINSDNGLIGVPQREDSFLTVTTIFEPRIIVGQVLEIESKIQKEYNGQYKVIGIRHNGIISEAIGGALTSTFNLLTQTQLFGEFKQV